MTSFLKGRPLVLNFWVRAKRAGFRIQEVHIVGHRPRVAGSPTGAKPTVILRAFKELVQLRLQLWREKRQFLQNATPQ